MLKKLFGKTQSPRTVTLHPSQSVFDVSGKQTILQAALDQGLNFPYSCRVGGCATCKCKLTSGKVKELTDKSYLLSAEEMREGYILACQSVPRTDVQIEIDLLTSEQQKHTRSAGRLSYRQKVTDDIWEIKVELEKPILYKAGQYVNLTVPGIVNQGRSYSCAGMPENEGNRTLRFLIRYRPGGAFTSWLHKEAKVGDKITAEGPAGDFWLRPSESGILCLAGGSGLAPLLSILHRCHYEKITRPVRILFGARAQADLYAHEELADLKSNWPESFELIPILSEEPEDSDWQGARGMIPELLSAHTEFIASAHAYLCGPPPMIAKAKPILEQMGMDPADIHADAFTDRSMTQQ